MIVALAGFLSPVGQEAERLPWNTLAESLVKRMDLQAGERVMLLAHPGQFEELVPHLRLAVIRAGGIDMGCLDVLDSSVAAKNPALRAEGFAKSRKAFGDLLKGVDLTVKLPARRASQWRGRPVSGWRHSSR